MILELISISLSIKLSQLSQISAVTWSGLELQPGANKQSLQVVFFTLDPMT